ncbi:MAG: heavy-metal-associated domain-containing protein [Bacteroidetes bacterium]|nr:heavy-metal-associated domain-containing protein [Bacteroidota bacterium]
MTHTYVVKGVTCEGCVAKVKSKLLMHPDVSSADVKLQNQKTTITMQRHLTVDELQEAIGRGTKYQISADATDHSHAELKDSHKSWLATYKPLLIIAAFIGSVSILTSSAHVGIAMNNFMAGFFLVFSFFKFLDLKAFASSYAMYDVLTKKLPVYGYVYPFIELALGLAFLTGFNPIVTNWTTLIVMGFSSIGVIQSVVSKQKIRCACLGAVFNLPMSTVTIVEDALMVAMSGLLLIGVH